MATLVALLALASLQAPSDTTYFEQDVRYRIEARLEEEMEVLRARARMHYGNRSSRRIDTLYFHLHLNAFRPNSAWARRELESDNRRFQDLGPTEHAYERLQMVSIAGDAAQPIYPGAPDSTVVAVPLSTPLEPGDSTIVDLAWEAVNTTASPGPAWPSLRLRAVVSAYRRLRSRRLAGPADVATGRVLR